ncbi:MAG: DNA-binding protein [bacterium]|jgi:hypothetical protein|nr:DNA-binding protein [bacterium]
MKILTMALALALLAAGADAAGFSGTVKQTMNSGGYTYVLLDTGQGEIWLAGPEAKVSKGQKLSTGDGMAMHGFQAKSLNRTFDEIWFVNSLSAGAGSGAAGGAAMANPHGSPMGNPHAGMPLASQGAPKPGAAKPKAGSVKKAGHTVSELYFQPRLLAGKTVEVRGVVTKYNEGIMGSNWIHLMDGTGEPGRDDLVITTSQTCQVGDRIVAKGKLAVDRDLGSGYFFPVLVEGAALTVEAAGKGK